MKIKTIAVILAALLVFGLCACTGNTPAVTETDTTDTVITTKTETKTDTDTEPAPEKEYTGTLEVDLRPVPVNASISVKGEDSAPAALLSPSDGEYNDVFALFGFETGEGGLPVTVNTDASLEEEEYKLKVAKDGVTVTASGRRGVFTAVSTLAQLRFDGRLAAAEIEDKPAVAYRGVIEGFYGTAWTRQFRLDLFSFMGKYKLNTYMYAPKDDPKHRSEWRKLYTEKELKTMREYVDTAIENNVRFVYAISPGLDMDLGSGYDADFAKLCEKCASMYDIGVRDFAILLDDIPTLDAAGHAKLLNDFQTKFVKTHDGCTDLIMITPEFCQALTTGYTDAIAPLIDPDIMVMWTGDYVLPVSITESNLRSITNKLGRKMYIWWNYPVNDTMADQLFMGPCVNLDTNLFNSISGLVSNPMNQGYASEVPLITIADYLWNPDDYDPEASVSAAVKYVSPDCSDGLYALMDLTRDTAINGNKSSFALKDDISAYNKKENGAAEKLLSKLEKMKEDLEYLVANCERKLYSEIKLWLKKAVSYVTAAVAYLKFDMTADQAERASFAMQFVSAMKECENSAAQVSPDVLTPFLSAARSDVNSMLGGAAAADGRKLTSTLQTYADYVPAYALDGDTSTFFWTAGSPVSGSTFTVDLGAVTDITGVRLLMGVDGHADDYIRDGVIEYSVDGKDYTRLCSTAGRTTEKTENFSARYVRLRCTAPQQYWLIISEFEIRTKFVLSDNSSFDGSSKTDLSPIFDNNLFTSFHPEASAVNGKTLKIDVTGCEKARLYLVKTDGVRVYTVTANKEQSADINLSEFTEINVKDKAYLCLTFGNKKPEIAEIVIK